MENRYTLVKAKANEIEAELKRLNRWSHEPLHDEQYEDMGAFGMNTMAFEQWIQFILLQRIEEIIQEHGDFPAGSSVGVQAIRVFDGDPDASQLQSLLSELDYIINQNSKNRTAVTDEPVIQHTSSDTVTMGDTTIPPLLFELAELLPQYEGDGLESQLQTFDTFLAFLSPTVRPTIRDAILKAANVTTNPTSKQRIEQAAQSIATGGRAAAPYNHGEAMRKHEEEHRKSFPDAQ